MGILPGGTGNGFATEMGIPHDYRKAVEVLCTSQNVRQVDIMRIGEQYCIQRLYAGIEPEQQVSREQKNKYGTLAYALMTRKQIQESVDAPITLTIDGQRFETHGLKCYVVNSGQGGKGYIDKEFRVDDGILMCSSSAATRSVSLRPPSGSSRFLRSRRAHVLLARAIHYD
jgi:diacylglycerol kinase family enzyme